MATRPLLLVHSAADSCHISGDDNICGTWWPRIKCLGGGPRQAQGGIHCYFSPHPCPGEPVQPVPGAACKGEIDDIMYKVGYSATTDKCVGVWQWVELTCMLIC